MEAEARVVERSGAAMVEAVKVEVETGWVAEAAVAKVVAETG